MSTQAEKTTTINSTKITLHNRLLATSWEDAWVHEGGHTEVGQHKKEDYAIVYWYGNRKILGKPWAPET